MYFMFPSRLGCYGFQLISFKRNRHEFLDIRLLGDESNAVFIPEIGVHSSKLVVVSLPLKNRSKPKRQLVFKTPTFQGLHAF